MSAVLFWLSLASLFYCYLGYGMLLALFSLLKKPFRRKRIAGTTGLPAVTLIISAYNESEVLAEKIRNSLGIDYPKELLQILVVTDGSDDGSPELISSHPDIRVLHQPERRGKYAAIKRAMQHVSTPVVLFTDANSMVNPQSVSRLVRHYADPRVGAVAGEKKILSKGSPSAVGAAEGVYWKYESILKRLDAEFHTVVGASGELFSIRTRLFRPRPEPVILDDFLTSMDVCLQGYRVAYEPSSFAMELPSLSLAEEEKRKVRIAAGAFEAIGLLGSALNPLRFPLLSFQFFSRRVLRWALCPLLIPLVFVSNLVLALRTGMPTVYDWLLGAQIVFYVLAGAGWYLARRNRSTGLLTVPFYFLFMNFCLVRGFLRFLQGAQSPAWEKSLRVDKVKG